MGKYYSSSTSIVVKRFSKKRKKKQYRRPLLRGKIGFSNGIYLIHTCNTMCTSPPWTFSRIYTCICMYESPDSSLHFLQSLYLSHIPCNMHARKGSLESNNDRQHREVHKTCLLKVRKLRTQFFFIYTPMNVGKCIQ